MDKRKKNLQYNKMKKLVKRILIMQKVAKFNNDNTQLWPLTDFDNKSKN